MSRRFMLFVALVLCAPLLFSQTLVEKLYVLRAETVNVDPYSGTTHVCVLVYPDGQYRMEKSFQGPHDSSPEERVYLDSLPEAGMKQLQAVLDDGKFQAISTGIPEVGTGQADTLTVSVPREHMLQSFAFASAKDRKPYEKDLKPFLAWMKDLEKRKASVARNESLTNCTSPQVVYRSSHPGPGLSDQR